MSKPDVDAEVSWTWNGGPKHVITGWLAAFLILSIIISATAGALSLIMNIARLFV